MRPIRPVGATAILLACLLLAVAFPARTHAQLPSAFPQSALNAINSDLSSEIIAGSSNAGTVASPFYLPASNLNMLPCLVGSTGTGGLENLLKVSTPSPFFSGATYSGTGISRASPALTTGTSLDGRYFTPALWNAPLLLPVTSGTDFTPLLSTGTFTLPAWIMVARDGSNPTTWSPALLTSTNNTSTVIGRYAYTIYHEGGLLDANVAGYPSTSSTFQIEYKPALPYADLTQIGLTPSQIDTLVGWRNYASTQAPGTPTTPDFTAASGSNYYQFVLSNTTGYLTPSAAEFNGQTDQSFTSRQQLIDFMQNTVGLTGTGLDTLNYLATFTRGVNQPSYSPDPTRPLIVNPYTNGGNNLVQGVGNSYELRDSAGNYDDPVNPSFPTVLVSGTFARNDGSTAVVGEPLVNKRFALNRLAWLTYLGPSANRTIPTTNPGPSDPNYDMWQLVNVYGISPAYLAQGTPANIQNYFGLVWQVDTEPGAVKGGAAQIYSFHDGEYKWFYMGHNTFPGSSTPGTLAASSTTGSISRLQAIANLGSNARDPDFFELLKAGVAAGSIAKASMNTASITSLTGSFDAISPYYYQTKLDFNLDFAIIQLGANIIDQFKVDGYSTRIVFSDGFDPAHEFRGVENLPYLYRVNSGTLKLRMENPQYTGASSQLIAKLVDPGVAMIMEMPTIWNPHDALAPIGIPGPTAPITGGINNFRLIADSMQPNYMLNPTNPVSTGTSAATVDGYAGFWATGSPDGPYNLYYGGQNYSNGAGALVTGSTWTTGTGGSGLKILPSLIGAGAVPPPLIPQNSMLTFSDTETSLFREPTILAAPGIPAGSHLQLGVPPTNILQYATLLNQRGQLAYQGLTGGFLSDGSNPLNIPNAIVSSTQGYIGTFAALYPVEFCVATGTFATPYAIYHSDYANLATVNLAGPFLTYRLQYQDPNPANTAGTGWVTYDEKYVQISTYYLGTPFGTEVGNLTDSADEVPGADWESYVDPRTSRFAAVNGRDLLSPVQTPGGSTNLGSNATAEWPDPNNNVVNTDRPDVNAGYCISSNRPPVPGYPEFVALAANGWSISTIAGAHFRTGMLSQNSASIYDNGIRFNGDNPNNGTFGDGPQPTYYSDPDNVVRGAMGNYQQANGTVPATDSVGLPLATAYSAGTFASTSGTYQGESRPYFLHRPFRSVAELSYAFSGTPWKNIDFFTPQSGDAPLLDLFTINETPPESSNPNDLVAGTVNLNTHQAPVLQALLSGAYVDEAADTAFPPITGPEANSMLISASGLISRTTNTATGQGPLQNLSELVGKWNNALAIGGTNDYSIAYTGPSGDLTNAYASAFGAPILETIQNVQRFRESFIRPLAAVGNTRVWNLMIDLVAQTGQYPATANGFDNFLVNCEQRYWIHEAIDRCTGQIVDQTVETVGPSSLSLTGTAIADNLATGSTVATLGSSELLGGGAFTYALVSGTAPNDNADFTINGNQLQTNAVFDYLTKSTYKILISVTDASGLTYLEPLTITVQPGPYTQWKIANFGPSSTNPAIAGDLVDAENDGLPNLVKYALGKSPNSPATTGFTVQSNGTMLTMNYTRSSAATDVTVNVATSTNIADPSSWTSSGVTQTMLSDNGTIQQWQATAPLNGNNAMFMQLTVSRP